MRRESRLEGEGLAGIGADGLGAEPMHVALLDQELPRQLVADPDALRAEAARTTDARVREMLSRIADDEDGHVRLAEDVVRFCTQRDTDRLGV